MICNLEILQIRKSLADRRFSLLDRLNLFGDLVGLGTKYVFAFVWQEESRLSLPEWMSKDWVFSRRLNELGSYMMPVVNVMANLWNHFTYSDRDFAVVRIISRNNTRQVSINAIHNVAVDQERLSR